MPTALQIPPSSAPGTNGAEPAEVAEDKPPPTPEKDQRYLLPLSNEEATAAPNPTPSIFDRLREVARAAKQNSSSEERDKEQLSVQSPVDTTPDDLQVVNGTS